MKIQFASNQFGGVLRVNNMLGGVTLDINISLHWTRDNSRLQTEKKDKNQQIINNSNKILADF